MGAVAFLIDPVWWLGGVVQLVAFGAWRWTYRQLRSTWRWLHGGPLVPLIVGAVVVTVLRIGVPNPGWRLRALTLAMWVLVLVAAFARRRPLAA